VEAHGFSRAMTGF